MSAPNHIVFRNDESYPALLRACSGAPEELHYEGDLDILSAPCVSIVGSRVMTPYGKMIVRSFVPTLVRAGLTIVSGLAYGVDSEVHKVALEHDGRCVAVLGNGIDITYPSNHAWLRQQIVQSGGCLVSEYPPGTPPLRHHFPERNRIVAGLSQVTVVIEAGVHSGSLITARLANEFGRSVCAVPGDITRPQSLGIVALLGDIAQAVAKPEDVIILYKEVTPAQLCLDLRPALTGSLASLYALISRGEETIDRLLTLTGLSLPELQSALTVLELDNYINRTGQRWQRIS